MKPLYKLAGFLFILLLLGGCMALYKTFFDVTLEPKDVQNFKVEKISAHPTRLRLSGLAFNSSMGISKITTKQNGSILIVLVHLSVAHRAASGNLSYELTVPDSVNEVRFGSSSENVWKRGDTLESTPKSPSGSSIRS
jgi:hypothetical protein